MSNPDALCTVTYEAESTFGENVNTFTTYRLPIIDPIDCSGLIQEKRPGDFAEQYRGAGHVYFNGPMGGSFKTRMWLAGHGATTAGAPTVDPNETILNYVFGGTGAFSLATSTTCTGGTTAIPTTAAASGVSAGGLVRIGAFDDHDGDGQFYAVSTHSGSNLNLLNELRGAPANGAVVYPVYQIFSNSEPAAASNAPTGLRFEILTANTQYQCHGCYPMNVTFAGTDPNQQPTIEIEWGVSWWTDQGSTTFPSAVTSNRHLPAPNGGGMFHVQAVGTTTRNEYHVRSFSINYNLGVVPQEGFTTTHQYSKNTGAARTNNESCTLEFVIDSPAAGSTPFADWARTETSLIVVVTLNSVLSRAVGFKFPKFCQTTVPTQTRIGNINRIKITGVCHTGDTLTNELTRARMILGLS